MGKSKLQAANNFFDNLKFDVDPAEVLRQQDELKAKQDKLDYLIHQTFEQHQPGKELLGLWSEILIMQPGATPEMDKIEIGIREGYKKFIRSIKTTIIKVDKGD